MWCGVRVSHPSSAPPITHVTGGHKHSLGQNPTHQRSVRGPAGARLSPVPPGCAWRHPQAWQRPHEHRHVQHSHEAQPRLWVISKQGSRVDRQGFFWGGEEEDGLIACPYWGRGRTQHITAQQATARQQPQAVVVPRPYPCGQPALQVPSPHPSQSDTPPPYPPTNPPTPSHLHDVVCCPLPCWVWCDALLGQH